jgi:hypothetical protein
VPRPCRIDTHPERDSILDSIARGETLQAIATRYGLTKSAVQRYVAGAPRGPIMPYARPVVPDAVAEARIAAGVTADQSIKGQIHYVLEKMRKLYDACDEYLSDPNRPGHYDLMPRAWEYEVVYRENEPDTDRMVTKKATLQWLLEKVDAQGYQPWEVKMKSEDPRRLILGTAGAIAKHLELLGKLEGSIQEKVEVNLTLNQTWLDIKALIIRATDDAPEVQAKILSELARHE